MMRTTHSAIGGLHLLILALFSCCAAQAPNPGTAHESPVPPIEALLTERLALKRFSGSVLIAKGGAVIFNESYGMGDLARALSPRVFAIRSD